jgi:electron-transferring-flavoprotein dehydrogenase
MMQLAQDAGRELNLCVVEKGSEVGAHIISGAVFEPTPLDELFPDWRELGTPVTTAVSRDDVYYLAGDSAFLKVPGLLIPRPMRNEGNYIISLGNLCRWLGDQAEAMGVNIFAGFAASEVLYEQGRVVGVATGDMGVAADGTPKEGYQAGYELRAPYTIFAEGCRGSLGKELARKFELRKHSDPQHYGLGLKEIWTVAPERHKEGLVVHTFGWPLSNSTEGGGFLYHAGDNLVYLGLIVAMNYRNPYLNPFLEFQRWKHHPRIRRYLEGGERISYGARAVNKGGLQTLPQLTFPGGLLAGCEAGFLNGVKVKGSHTAMKTGMLAAEAVFESLQAVNSSEGALDGFDTRVRESWVYDELSRARNFGPAQHKFGTFLGSAFTWFDQNVFRGRLPFTLHNRDADHECIDESDEAQPIEYPRPDGKISFDLLSSVYLSSTNHEEDQPCHLQLADSDIPLNSNLPRFDEPAQRYCPAGVYEVVEDAAGQLKFTINAANCVHCKTCDIKDPAQNINWVVAEGGGGPNYSGM